MSSITTDIENFWTNGIKPNLCAFAVTAGGVYFLSPMLIPYTARLPIVGNFSLASQSAMLAGGYAVASVTVCSQMGLARFL